jgi:hypothetical protein
VLAPGVKAPAGLKGVHTRKWGLSQALRASTYNGTKGHISRCQRKAEGTTGNPTSGIVEKNEGCEVLMRQLKLKSKFILIDRKGKKLIVGLQYSYLSVFLTQFLPSGTQHGVRRPTARPEV